MAKSIKIENELWKRVEEHVADAGYSSAEEFMVHAIEQALAQLEQGAVEAERQLRGLGYLE